MNSAEMASYLIERSKNLKKFVVEREVPDGFVLHGVTPFDLRIKKNRITCLVYALTEIEAQERVDNYLAGNEKDL